MRDKIGFILLVILLIFSLIFNLIALKDIIKYKNNSQPMAVPTRYAYDIYDGPQPTEEPIWDGPILSSFLGAIEGPSGKETYYNLPMDGVIYYMRELGYNEDEYPYWIRNDGCKMFGPYIMCAAALDIRPKGTILESSLGTCIVCDTGEFVNWNHTQIDIAVNW